VLGWAPPGSCGVCCAVDGRARVICSLAELGQGGESLSLPSCTCSCLGQCGLTLLSCLGVISTPLCMTVTPRTVPPMSPCSCWTAQLPSSVVTTSVCTQRVLTRVLEQHLWPADSCVLSRGRDAHLLCHACCADCAPAWCPPVSADPVHAAVTPAVRASLAPLNRDAWARAECR
jgi:hypothetical protein